jgi:hypothetical protein
VPNPPPFTPRPERRALPRSLVLKAAFAGGLVTLALFVPLIAGLARMQRLTWEQMAAHGVHPAPVFYAPWPLQVPRVLVLALFALDIGFWAAHTMLPVHALAREGYFGAARRRLRRHWLIAHAPFFPTIALLAAARLHALGLSTTGAGAALFAPALAATGEGFLLRGWITTEHLLLVSLGATFLVHLALLAGITRPRRWLRNVGVLALAAGVLTAAGVFVVLPVSDGGLVRTMAAAREDARRACPGVDALEVEEQIATVYSAFSRTALDSPALRQLPYPNVPLSIAVPPALPLANLAGLAVQLDVPPRKDTQLAVGHELTVAADGAEMVLPLPAVCAAQRVLKLDRALRWQTAGPLLARSGPGELRLGFRPAPAGAPRALRPDESAPILRLLEDAGQVPPGVPHRRLPLDLPGASALPGAAAAILEDRPQPRRDHPFVLWAETAPLPLPPAPDTSGRIALVVEPESTWDEILRAIAAARRGGANEILLAPAEPHPEPLA